MRLPFVALVAILGFGAPGALAARTEVDPPIRVTVALPVADRTIDGMVRAWDERTVWIVPRGRDGDSAEPVEIPWSEIDADHTYAVWMRLMDKKAAGAWAHLGIAMLDVADIERADRAFAQAERLDPAHKAVITEIRAAHARGEDAHALVPAPGPESPERGVPPDAMAPDGPAKGEGGESDKPNPVSDVPADQMLVPWAAQTDAERAAAVADLKARAEEMLRVSGVRDVRAVETDYFLMCSNLAAPEVRRWSGVLDTMYRTMLTTLEIPKDALLFHGKCVIFIFRTRDDFLRFELSAFEMDAARAGGVCHLRGPETWVSFFRGKDDARFQSVLVHETTHAFMHRYRSPAPLPTWANEGLADYIAGVLTPGSDEPERHWQWASHFVGAGLDPVEIMGQSYEDGTWFTSYSYPVSHMLVRYMLKYKPRAFKEWIDDIKGGVDADAAMRARFGVTRQELAKGFAAETRSERSYTRTR